MPRPSGQQLSFDTIELEDSQKLSDYNIQNGDIVDLQPKKGFKVTLTEEKKEEEEDLGLRPDNKNDGIGGAWVIVPAVTVIVAFDLYLFSKKKKNASKK